MLGRICRPVTCARKFTTILNDAVLRPTTPSGTVGSLLDSQVVHNHLRNGVHVVEQSFCQWTFGELKNHVDAVAKGLLAMHFSPGDRLALALPNNAEMIVATLAAAKVGAIVVPLSASPSEATLTSVLKQGVRALIFTDVAGETDYGKLISKLVPEVHDFAGDMNGYPFKSLTYPATKFLISTGKNRVPGMLRYQWIPEYSYSDDLRQHGKLISASTPFFQEIGSNQVATHGDILAKARAVFGNNAIKSDSIVAVGAPLTKLNTFVAGYAAAHHHGCLSVFSQENDSQAFDMILKVKKPNVFVADQNAMKLLADLKSPQPVQHLVLVEKCDAGLVGKVKEALGSSSVLNV